MAELATIARPYANAVFELAKRSRTLDRWSDQLGLAALVCADASVNEIIESPAATSLEKADTLARVCGDELSEEGRQLLRVLAHNDRLDALGEISAQYEALRAQEEASLDVEVVSAYPLDDAEQKRLVEALTRRFKKDIQVTSRVEESLLGGAIIRAGDTVIDGSVRGKLNKLSESIQRT